LRLFSNFDRSNPFIPSTYQDTYHPAQRIIIPFVLKSSADLN